MLMSTYFQDFNGIKAHNTIYCKKERHSKVTTLHLISLLCSELLAKCPIRLNTNREDALSLRPTESTFSITDYLCLPEFLEVEWKQFGCQKKLYLSEFKISFLLKLELKLPLSYATMDSGC